MYFWSARESVNCNFNYLFLFKNLKLNIFGMPICMPKIKSHL